MGRILVNGVLASNFDVTKTQFLIQYQWFNDIHMIRPLSFRFWGSFDYFWEAIMTLSRFKVFTKVCPVRPGGYIMPVLFIKVANINLRKI